MWRRGSLEVQSASVKSATRVARSSLRHGGIFALSPMVQTIIETALQMIWNNIPWPDRASPKKYLPRFTGKHWGWISPKAPWRCVQSALALLLSVRLYRRGRLSLTSKPQTERASSCQFRPTWTWRSEGLPRRKIGRRGIWPANWSMRVYAVSVRCRRRRQTSAPMHRTSQPNSTTAAPTLINWRQAGWRWISWRSFLRDYPARS